MYLDSYDDNVTIDWLHDFLWKRGEGQVANFYDKQLFHGNHMAGHLGWVIKEGDGFHITTTTDGRFFSHPPATLDEAVRLIDRLKANHVVYSPHRAAQ